MKRTITIGTRGSQLALWQAHHIEARLNELGVQTSIKIIKTQGDLEQKLKLDKLEGKNFFTKEIEEELTKKTIDLAVHSFKDLSTHTAKGLGVAAVTARERVEDVLIIRKSSLAMHEKYLIQKNAVVGTSSNRRIAQMASIRPDLEFKHIRGNINTRIQKLINQEVDAVMLAYAGILRLQLDLSAFEVVVLDVHEIVPAPAQGALALQIRTEDQELGAFLSQYFHSEQDAECIGIERMILNRLGGGCSLPFGAYCYKEYQTYKVWLSFAHTQTGHPVRFFLQDKDPQVLIEKSVSLLQKKHIPKIPTVFISRNKEEINLFSTYLQHFNIEVYPKKLIQTIPIPFSNVPTSDWIFFNSKTGVHCFFSKNPVLREGIKFGVLGEATHHALTQYGYIPAFVGSHSDIKKVAKEFRKYIESEQKMPIVLFPQSSIGLRTIQEELAFAAKTIDLLVYRTNYVIDDQQIVDADYYIFTSPSNVASFFLQKSNLDKRTQKMIALGKSTYEALKDKGIINVLVSEKNSEVGLINALMTDIYLQE